MGHGIRKKPDSEEGYVASNYCNRNHIFGCFCPHYIWSSLVFTRKLRKAGLIIVSSITVLLLLSFAIRPYWIDYQVSRKTEQLNHYLEEKYPNQEWEISRQAGRQYNPYHLQVRFKNEEGWIYIYSVVNEKKIHQSVWVPSGGNSFEEGKHYEK